MTAEQSDLLVRSIQLFMVIAAGGALSAFIFRYMVSCGMMVVSFIVTVIMIIAIHFWIGPSGNVPAIMISVFIFGAAATAPIGGAMLVVAAKAGMDADEAARTIFTAIGITLGATIAAGLIGVFSGFNFQFLGTGLFIFLNFLIFWGLGAIIGLVSRKWDMIVGWIAVPFWFLYMIYDFNQAVTVYTQNTWPAATHIAMGVYLDFLNMLWRIFLILVDSK